MYPNVGAGRRGHEAALQPVLVSGRHPEPRGARNAGSIHEGGELGYSLSHAYGAAFDNPDLIVACVVGDGEAETGPLATSWHSNKFLNPATDGAVLPILHLNGYKIANPTSSHASATRSWTRCSAATATRRTSWRATTRRTMHQQMAATLDTVVERSSESKRTRARSGATNGRGGR